MKRSKVSGHGSLCEPLEARRLLSAIPFAAQPWFGEPHGLSAYADVTAADMDGDGDKDVVAAFMDGIADSPDRTIPSLVVWFAQQQDGTFTAVHDVGEGRVSRWAIGLNSLVATDLDSDGDQDVAVLAATADLGATRLLWHENVDGRGGAFRTHLIREGTSHHLVAVDLDGDGHQDLVTPASSDKETKLVWFRNVDGRGDFEETPLTDQPFVNFDVADVNGDQRPDLLITTRLQTNRGDRGQFQVLQNQGGGRFNLAVTLDLGIGQPLLVGTADYDADSDVDVFVFDLAGQDVFVLDNPGELGRFALNPEPVFILGFAATRFESADLDLDNRPEIVHGSSCPAFCSSHDWITISSPGNGDAATDQTVDRTRLRTAADVLRAGGNHIELVDLDGDGDLDILSPFLSRGWYRNDTVHAPEVGDVTGDGRIGVADVDRLCSSAHAGEYFRPFDYDLDGKIGQSDVSYLVEGLLKSSPGDVNLDGVFDSSDLVRVFQKGEYEDGIDGKSTWQSGDWNCDGRFDSADLILAFRSGRYESAGQRTVEDVATEGE